MTTAISLPVELLQAARGLRVELGRIVRGNQRDVRIP
jgi:hypothetical protein